MPTMIPRTIRIPNALTLTAVASAAMLAACGNSGSTGGGAGAPGNGGEAPNVPVTVATNVSGQPGTLEFYVSSLNNPATGTLTSGSNEGIDYDATATLIQAGDNGSLMDGFTGLRFFTLPNTRSGQFNPIVDRQIDLSGMTFGGKGIEVIDSLGRIIVANNAASTLDVFSTTAGPGAMPLAQLMLDAAPWDSAYDTRNDRLYVALTDGTVAIYDDFAGNVDNGMTMPSRILTPVDDMDAKISVNMHGIAVREGNVSAIILSDVGAANAEQGADFASDGALFRINDDGTLDGNVPPSGYYRVAGDQTLLGNPVDLTVSGTDVVVAEKTNDLVLTFSSFTRSSGMANLAPDAQRAVTKPESVTVSNLGIGLRADNTDLTTPAGTVFVVSNPAPVVVAGNVVGPAAMDNATITFLDRDLVGTDTFDAGVGTGTGTDFRSTENIQVDTAGNAYVSFDTGNQTGPANAGITVINRLESRAGGSMDLPNTDRDILGAGSELVAPKGVEIVQSAGIMLVADAGGDGAIQAFALNVGGGDELEPLFSTTEVGSGTVWDLDYDPDSDTLFAAGTTGELLVYADYLDNDGDVTPTATRLNSDAMATSNLHGIVHIGNDTVIASDVANPDGAVEDGLIYVVSDASGTPTVTATITGPAGDALNNPVDLAFDGTSLFVAEKVDGMVYRYDSILSATDGSLEPDAMAEITAPESVALVP